MTANKFQFAIDRGGTFTDVWAKCPNGKVRVMKLLSEDPANYADAPKEAIRRILQQETGSTNGIDTNQIEWIRMGTTVATNALLERKGEPMVLVTTKGFRDLLHIGNQSRPNIFDLEIVCPENLYDSVVEVDERVILQQDKCQVQKDQPWVKATTGEMIQVWNEVDLIQLQKDLQHVFDQGVRSLAVVLMHSYIYPAHEQAIGHLATEMGFTNVSLSSKVMSMARIVPRGYTACADAYLTPCIKKYIEGFREGLKDTKVLFMRSDGGLTPMERFMGCHAILSGPAGGVVGYAQTTYDADENVPVIGFDMGGTSTDVSRYSGHFEHVFETTTAGVTIQAPQLDINTVAAGGGSMLFFRAGMFVVGPDSAGAHPGPTCYMKGGPLTITDANLCLGRLLPEYFPHIFGKNEDQPLDKATTLKAFDDLMAEVNEFLEQQSEDGGHFKPMSREEIALGFVRVANETMCRPIRALTQAKGYDTSRHTLACFGGAGGQHACAIARSLGMETVFIHKYAGILSAFGMALADVVYEAQEPSALSYSPEYYEALDERIEALEDQCRRELLSQGFHESDIELEPFLNLRYEGTDCALMCTAILPASTTTTTTTNNNNHTTNGSGNGHSSNGTSSAHSDFYATFLNRYQTEFGFTLGSRQVCVDDIRVRGVGKSKALTQNKIGTAQGEPVAEKTVPCWFDEGCLDTRIFVLDKLQAGHTIPGPAIIIDANSTVLVEPNCCAEISIHGDIAIKVGNANKKVIGTDLDAIQLSIFSHRFMSIAEQMGRVLQRTAISTNIKERLDFSCAMFGPDGGLVANAPHIPVHLGAMQETVQYQMRQLADDIRDGDVILSNHPQAGGSHLPDLTVITPVFHKASSRPVFYVASRGHHADIGGITPGSMPPHSTSIFQEGAVFKSFKLVQGGQFREKELIQALNEPAKYPESSGTRNLPDNLSDLRAQVAANQKGIRLILELIDEYGLDVVQAYMKHIQDNAELAVKDMLRGIALRTRERTGKTQLYGEDFMDGGFKICLNVGIDEDEGTAVFDFTGTCCQVHGNINAPRAITMSAIIYCLRCMVGHEVPLNQGCLTPIRVILPKGSLIDPSETAAVVGGNVLTSQRIVDVVFRAFGVCAASQGCMNNVTFGDESMGYYETVAGGAGAGPGWNGRSGVHSHMTNTRITDPEIMEKRYPVILQRFHLNPGSGGRGQYNGGDGVIRELMFRRPLTLSLLTERRVFSPYGLKGGLAGSPGRNLMLYADGRVCNLGAKTAVCAEPGDVFRLETPGGGGYGCPSSNGVKNNRRGDDDNVDDDDDDDKTIGESASFPKRSRTTDGQAASTRHGGGSLFTYQRLQESA